MAKRTKSKKKKTSERAETDQDKEELSEDELAKVAGGTTDGTSNTFLVGERNADATTLKWSDITLKRG